MCQTLCVKTKTTTSPIKINDNENENGNIVVLGDINKIETSR